jgi:hypothetical protein
MKFVKVASGRITKPDGRCDEPYCYMKINRSVKTSIAHERHCQMYFEELVQKQFKALETYSEKNLSSNTVLRGLGDPGFFLVEGLGLETGHVQRSLLRSNTEI